MFTTPPIHQAEFSSIDEEEEDASSATSDVEDCDVVKTDEDREWEECMERRRMMFAMRCKETKDEQPECGQPAFEGYRSLGALSLSCSTPSTDTHPSVAMLALARANPTMRQFRGEGVWRGCKMFSRMKSRRDLPKATRSLSVGQSGLSSRTRTTARRKMRLMLRHNTDVINLSSPIYTTSVSTPTT
jgi:hypothetical protein